jgi:hypothetical protein
MGHIGTSVNARKSAGRLHLYMCEHLPLLSAVSDKINTFVSLLKMEHAMSTLLVRTSRILWKYLSRHLKRRSILGCMISCNRNCDDDVVVKEKVHKTIVSLQLQAPAKV